MRIALVAGEPSGDLLGASLIAALKKHYPQARFEGIGGERMQNQGFETLFPLEKLSVMGLVEVIRHLPELLLIRRSLYRRFAAEPPAAFIGIDAPDFNLGLEQRLRARGVPTVHYVSPTVWAWRRRRVRKIARAVDLMLTLYPFEADFYREHAVPVRFVGHPLADDIHLQTDRLAARHALELAEEAGPLVALLPGSRLGEVETLAPLFVDCARWLLQQRPDLRFAMPAATERLQHRLLAILARSGPDLPITLIRGRAREIMAAADVVLLASGTATLEALLLKRPMVVAYKMAPLTVWLVSRLIKVPYVSQPNLLAGRELIEEFIQDDATVENIGPALLALLDDPQRCARLEEAFMAIHRQLRRNASVQAAEAVAGLLDGGKHQWN